MLAGAHCKVKVGELGKPCIRQTRSLKSKLAGIDNKLQFGIDSVRASKQDASWRPLDVGGVATRTCHSKLEWLLLNGATLRASEPHNCGAAAATKFHLARKHSFGRALRRRALAMVAKLNSRAQLAAANCAPARHRANRRRRRRVHITQSRVRFVWQAALSARRSKFAYSAAPILIRLVVVVVVLDLDLVFVCSLF